MVEPTWLARVEPDLRTVAEALGEARDLDVLVERLTPADGAPTTALGAPLRDAGATPRDGEGGRCPHPQRAGLPGAARRAGGRGIASSGRPSGGGTGGHRPAAARDGRVGPSRATSRGAVERQLGRRLSPSANRRETGPIRRRAGGSGAGRQTGLRSRAAGRTAGRRPGPARHAPGRRRRRSDDAGDARGSAARMRSTRSRSAGWSSSSATWPQKLAVRLPTRGRTCGDDAGGSGRRRDRPGDSRGRRRRVASGIACRTGRPRSRSPSFIDRDTTISACRRGSSRSGSPTSRAPCARFSRRPASTFGWAGRSARRATTSPRPAARARR